MKKRIIFALAVFALAAISCTPKEELKEQGVPFKATITAEQLVSRAVTDNGTTLTTNWAVDETIALIYEVSSVAYNTTATITSVAAGSATISATLQSGVTDGTSVSIVYPASAVSGTSDVILESVITTQNGALSAARDIRKGSGTISVGGGGATLAGGAVMAPQYAVCKFEMEDVDGSNSIYVTRLVLKDASDNIIATVTPGSATSTLYVTVPATSGMMWFEAVVSGANYVAKGTANLEAGYFYQPTVRMATVYNVIGADGKFYKDKDDAVAASTLAAAVIAYVGNETAEAGYTHGLALAVKNSNSGITCKWKTEESLSNANQYADYATALAAIESGSALCVGKDNADTYPGFYHALHNDFTPPTGTTNAKPSTGTSNWFLPSAFQMNQIVCGLMHDDSGLTALSQSKYVITLAKTGFEAAGGTWFSGTGYNMMTSTETSASQYWQYQGTGCLSKTGKTGSAYTRAALAF